MTVLNFSFGPEAVEKFSHAIVCLGKFSEAVTIEATKDSFALTTLNSTNSAYAAFMFAGNKFFTRYNYNPPRTNGVPKEKFCCKMYNKALHAVFKGRGVDPMREKDTSIERCEISIEDGAGEVKSRFVIKMIAKHGVIKTYRLTFEAHKSTHAFFDGESARNTWSIASRTLRDFVEHFGPGTEQLDINLDDDRVNFVSFTEKIMSGNEVLKQPLHTSIAIDTHEFSDLHLDPKLHIVINVKDFKAIVAHAGAQNTRVSAAYSLPTRPMQIKYTDNGMTCEFVLMTIGDHGGASATPTSGSTRSASSKRSAAPQLERRAQEHTSMPPPSRSATVDTGRVVTRSREIRPSPPPPQPTLEDESLFVSQNDDRQWDPPSYEDEEEEEMLGWDTRTNDDTLNLPYTSNLRINGQPSQTVNGRLRLPGGDIPQYIEPTQRLSQVRGGLNFDD